MSDAIIQSIINTTGNILSQALEHDPLKLQKQSADLSLMMMEKQRGWSREDKILDNELRQMNALRETLMQPLLNNLNSLSQLELLHQEKVPSYEGNSVDYSAILDKISADEVTSTQTMKDVLQELDTQIDAGYKSLNESRTNYSLGQEWRGMAQDLTMDRVTEDGDETAFLTGSTGAGKQDKFILDGIVYSPNTSGRGQLVSAEKGSEFETFVNYMNTEHEVDVLAKLNADIGVSEGFKAAKRGQDIAMTMLTNENSLKKSEIDIETAQFNLKQGKFNVANDLLVKAKGIQSDVVMEVGMELFTSFNVQNPDDANQRLYWVEIQSQDATVKDEFLKKFKKSLSNYGDAGQMVLKAIYSTEIGTEQDFGGAYLPMINLVEDIFGISEGIQEAAIQANLTISGDAYSIDDYLGDVQKGLDIPESIANGFQMLEDFKEMGILNQSTVQLIPVIEQTLKNIQLRESGEQLLIKGQYDDLIGTSGGLSLNVNTINDYASSNIPGDLITARAEYETKIANDETDLSLGEYLDKFYPQLNNAAAISSLDSLLADASTGNVQEVLNKIRSDYNQSLLLTDQSTSDEKTENEFNNIMLPDIEIGHSKSRDEVGPYEYMASVYYTGYDDETMGVIQSQFIRWAQAQGHAQMAQVGVGHWYNGLSIEDRKLAVSGQLYPHSGNW